MIGRFFAWVASVPAALWRGTVGRLFGGSPPPDERIPRAPIEPEEPQSVAGITFRVGLVVLGLFFAAYLLYELRLLLILVFLAILLAAGIVGAVQLFERVLPRILAVLVTYLLLVGVFSLALFLIFPPLVRQMVNFIDDLPSLFGELRSGAISLINSVAGRGTGEEVIDTLTSGLRGALPEVGSLLSVPLTVAAILVNTVVVIFLSALMLIERDKIRDYAMKFVDEHDRDAVMDVSHGALRKLGAYVRGQLLVMGVIGVGSAVGMLLLGVPFAIPLGALSFITAAIPLAGAFIAGIPIVLVALTVSPLIGLLMGIWLVVLQQLEGSVITPYIQGKVVNLSAVVVLLGVVAGTSLAGIVGGIIAIPLVAVGDVILRDIVFPLRRRSEERREERNRPLPEG